MSRLQLNSDQSIYYELIKGKSDVPYLVFLHEGLGCLQMWQNFPEELCRKTGCPGLLYDRTGYGKSSPLGSDRTVHYLHDYALCELPEVLQAIIPNRDYILIGHSDGGSISLISGAEQSPLLKGIVTEAAHVFVEPETIEGIRAADEAFERDHFKGLYKYHGDKTDNIFKAWSNTWLSNWFKFWNIEYLLPSVQCPLLAIQGKDDQYGTKYQVHSIVSKSSGPSDALFVKNCGHTPHLEQPDLLIEKISEFVTDIVYKI